MKNNVWTQSKQHFPLERAERHRGRQQVLVQQRAVAQQPEVIAYFKRIRQWSESGKYFSKKINFWSSNNSNSARDVLRPPLSLSFNCVLWFGIKGRFANNSELGSFVYWFATIFWDSVLAMFCAIPLSMASLSIQTIQRGYLPW